MESVRQDDSEAENRNVMRVAEETTITDHLADAADKLRTQDSQPRLSGLQHVFRPLETFHLLGSAFLTIDSERISHTLLSYVKSFIPPRDGTSTCPSDSRSSRILAGRVLSACRIEIAEKKKTPGGGINEYE